jgi:LysR family transcriptional regulator, cyn operon transcriptional activator
MGQVLMELRHIRYFVRAAELLHFTRAAESLYISQPTLSTHIQQLEEELGVLLFDRIGRNVRLTQAGNVFLPHAQHALQNLNRAKEKIADLKALVSGRIRLGALLTFGQEVLPSWIATFHNAYPQIRVDVQTGPSDFLEAELLSGHIDLALSFVPPTAEDIRSETLFSEEIYLVVGESHPFAQEKQIDIQALATIPLALVSRRWSARRIYDSFLSQHHVSPNILIEIDDLQALLKIASAGNVGVLLAKFAVGGNPNLRLIPIAETPLYINYGLLWLRQGYLNPAANAFLEHIKRK